MLEKYKYFVFQFRTYPMWKQSLNCTARLKVKGSLISEIFSISKKICQINIHIKKISSGQCFGYFFGDGAKVKNFLRLINFQPNLKTIMTLNVILAKRSKVQKCTYYSLKLRLKAKALILPAEISEPESKVVYIHIFLLSCRFFYVIFSLIFAVCTIAITFHFIYYRKHLVIKKKNMISGKI